MARRTSKSGSRASAPEQSTEAREKVLDSFEHTENVVDAEAAAIVAGEEPIEDASAAAVHALKESENLEAECETALEEPGEPAAVPAPSVERYAPYAAGALALLTAFFLGRASVRR